MSDANRHVMSAAEFAIEDAFASNPFKGLSRKEVVAHAVQIERDWYEAEITRLRARVAEQEVAIRRLQDRASKDAETFSVRVREAVEAEREACLHIAADAYDEDADMEDYDPYEPIEVARYYSNLTAAGIATAIRNRTAEGER